MSVLKREKERQEGFAGGGNGNVQKNGGGKEQVVCRR